MALTGLVNAYLMRLCLNIAILKMSISDDESDAQVKSSQSSFDTTNRKFSMFRNTVSPRKAKLSSR